MNTTPIERQFQRMGVRIKVQPPPPPRRRWNAEHQEYTLDVQRDKRGEHYVKIIAPLADEAKPQPATA